METLGFLLLSNIPGFSEEEIFKWQKWFFALPNEVKDKLIMNHFNHPDSPNHYRGLAPFIDNDISHKEFLEVGLDLSKVSPLEQQLPLHEPTPWPSHPETPLFQSFMTRHYDFMLQLGIKVMRHIAVGLGKPEGFFDSWFEKDTLSTLRIIHYMPRSAQVVRMDQLSGDELKMITPIHSDSGFLTLLTTYDYHGLQVDLGSGTFRSVRPVPSTLVVNLGDMFSRMTGYRLKATKHRVLDIGIERYSSPFFLEPHYLARIPTDLLTGEYQSVGEVTGEGHIYGDWLIDKIRSYGEYKHFKVTKPLARELLKGQE
ncbi:hypothetical protein FGO68_gene7206 [Halteria grandinella]|uniref:Fe2OG dioxygenase domain-containing protein n=1 Tax=Halteria grandinella TaxID=5974 RepID=A0A8J8T0H9_HALGN|nr:hypothetical protein FGO68_gene7206 [Halteria grandinella]